jgi:hypothetical protein
MVSEMHMLFDGTDTDTQIESSLHRLYTVTGVTVYVDTQIESSLHRMVFTQLLVLQCMLYLLLYLIRSVKTIYI